MSDAETERERGNALYLEGRFAEAAECYREALRLRPDDCDARNNLGAALADLGRLGEAVACYQEAIRARPELVEAYYNLGNVLRLAGRHDEAVACYAQALRLRPAFAEGHNNLAIVLRKLGRFAEAAASLRQALELRPAYTAALVNLGLTLADTGRLAEALAHDDEAIRLDPENADAHHNRALAWLLLGDWGRGWREYQWRWRCDEFAPIRMPGPAWDGSDPAGRTILLWTEQGAGDTLQLVRYARPVKQRGATVVLAAPERLHAILGGADGVDRIVAREPAPAGGFDAHCPLLTLPALFGTTTETVPGRVPYLHAERRRVAIWREALRPVEGVRVGIAWRGSPGMLPYDLRRSIPLERFAPLARVEGVRLVSLQAGPGSEQVAAVRGRFPVLDLAKEFDEAGGAFVDTAAVMANLDLVVTCDTAIAHLAGALGVATWVALPAVPDWRWLLDRDDSPWYPTARLFRQAVPGRWEDVFERMATALREGGWRGGGRGEEGAAGSPSPW
jgi:Flp pilus assembly protein TadD